MDAGYPGRLVLSDGPLDVQGVAVAGVSVTDHGDVHRSSDVFGIGDHLGHGQQSHVGEASLGGGASAGHVNGPKTHQLGDLGVEGVEHEGRHRQAIRIDHLA